MCSYLHTIIQHQAYIEMMSLWVKIKLKDLETCIDHAPTYLHTFCAKEGAWSLYISVKNHDTQTEKSKFI